MNSVAVVMVIAGAVLVCVGCAGTHRAARDAAEHDYRRLSGTWQLTRARDQDAQCVQQLTQMLGQAFGRQGGASGS